MEGWEKIGVQSASVLYPNSCYNESCYIEVQVYYCFGLVHICAMTISIIIIPPAFMPRGI